MIKAVSFDICRSLNWMTYSEIFLLRRMIMISSKSNSTLIGFYHWLEKQRNFGANLTTAYVNHHKTRTNPISHNIKRIGFSDSSELSTEINRIDN